MCRQNEVNDFASAWRINSCCTLSGAPVSSKRLLKDVRYAGSSVIEDGFTVVRGAPASLEITVSSNGASVKGALSDANGLPVAGVWVVLVPSGPRRGQYRLYKKQTTDQYGHFDLRGIAPGEYMPFSWDEVENGAWEDADFPKRFEEKGEKVRCRKATRRESIQR